MTARLPHSPAPWRVEPCTISDESPGGARGIIDPDNVVVAVVYENTPERDGNAAIVGSALDLREALRFLVSAASPTSEGRHVIFVADRSFDHIRGVLAKADGR